MSREAKLSAALACGMAVLALWLNRPSSRKAEYATIQLEEASTPERQEDSVGASPVRLQADVDYPPGAQGPTVEHTSIPVDDMVVIPLVYEPGYQLTEEGLYMRTAELWAQESFLNTHGSYWMGLPTLDDCAAGFADEKAKTFFAGWLWHDSVAASAAERPWFSMSTQDKLVLDRERQLRDAYADALFQRLDEVTSYKNWSTMGKNYREWIK